MTIRVLARFAAGLVLVLLQGCGSGGSTPEPAAEIPDGDLPDITGGVRRNDSYDVEIRNNVVYASALSHVDWNAPSPVEIDLLLDVYTPVNDEMERPVMVFIHGGGFIGGDKGTTPPRTFARYFAERGFVSMSINYRVLGDYGTIPSGFSDAVDTIPLLTDGERDQLRAMYPATRDAKAALRWLSANAEEFRINKDQISVIGGSAGSYIALALGATNMDDYTTEVDLVDDPTLTSTNLAEEVIVAAVVNHWGGPATVDLLTLIGGDSRWDATDAPVSIVHGTEDRTVPYALAEDLVDIYTSTGAYYELTTLTGEGHSAWDVAVNGQSLEALAFDFIARTVDIAVQEN